MTTSGAKRIFAKKLRPYIANNNGRFRDGAPRLKSSVLVMRKMPSLFIRRGLSYDAISLIANALW
jgi:hypothetical protein